MEEELFYEIERLRNCGKPIIVEGKKDKKALEQLGIGNVFTLDKPLFAVVEDIANRYDSVVLLTDMDVEGKKLFGELNRGFNKFGTKVDKRFRNFLLRKTGVRQVEGLYTYVKGQTQ